MGRKSWVIVGAVFIGVVIILASVGLIDSSVLGKVTQENGRLVCNEKQSDNDCRASRGVVYVGDKCNPSLKNRIGVSDSSEFACQNWVKQRPGKNLAYLSDGCFCLPS